MCSGQSLNGVFINDIKLAAQTLRPLVQGDLVRLGVAAAPTLQPEFVWTFHERLLVRRVHKRPSSGDAGDGPSAKRAGGKEDEDAATVKRAADAVRRAEEEKEATEAKLQQMEELLKKREVEQAALVEDAKRQVDSDMERRRVSQRIVQPCAT